MNTRILLTVTAILHALAGLVLTLLPGEVARQFGAVDATSSVLPYQLVGAAYLGFAVLNWLNQRSAIGGIFGRPLVFANFLQLFVGGFAVVQFATGPARGTVLPWVAAAVYFLLAACYGYLLFRKPEGRG